MSVFTEAKFIEELDLIAREAVNNLAKDVLHVVKRALKSSLPKGEPPNLFSCYVQKQMVHIGADFGMSCSPTVSVSLKTVYGHGFTPQRHALAAKLGNDLLILALKDLRSQVPRRKPASKA